MNISKKIGFMFTEDIPVYIANALLLRTFSPSNDADICGDSLIVSCRAVCTVPLEINNDDIILNLDNSIFIGNNKYYLLQNQLWDEFQPIRNCQISSSGVVFNISDCPL